MILEGASEAFFMHREDAAASNAAAAATGHDRHNSGIELAEQLLSQEEQACDSC